MTKEKSHFYDRNITSEFKLTVLCLSKIDYKEILKIALNEIFIEF